MSRKDGKGSKAKDILVVLLCLLGAGGSLNLFRVDLFQSIASLNNEPIGTITIKNNNVQRRLADRVLWSRLFVESPVYVGDLIRVAEVSEAVLHIEGNDIDVNENTLIRISQSPDGSFQIDLSEGSLSLVSGNGGIVLAVGGERVTAAPNTVLSAAAGKDGVTVQVNEGSAVIANENGRDITLAQGGIFALDALGVERWEAAAVLLRPKPNARLLKTGAEPVNVNFSWNRVNIDNEDPLRFEIAEDPHFIRIVHSEECMNEAGASLDAGVWYWRLSQGNAVVNSGHITIADASGAAAGGIANMNPADNAVLYYQDKPEALRFAWPEIEGASYYILEAGQTPDLQNPRIKKETSVTSVVEQNPAAGNWYWRVLPVFPAVYAGSAAYSDTASFRIEQGSKPELPEPEPEPVAELPPPTPVRPTPVRPAPRPAPRPVQQPVAPEQRLLPEPENSRPAGGYRFEAEELQNSKKIDFSWAAVPGANGYIVTLYEERGGRRRQIIRTNPVTGTSWTLENLSLLEQGSYVWQVEAVRMNSSGRIEQRGSPVENTFFADIPTSQVRIKDIGTLYGN